eukprot:2727136-Amphidinium_carterae.1
MHVQEYATHVRQLVQQWRVLELKGNSFELNVATAFFQAWGGGSPIRFASFHGLDAVAQFFYTTAVTMVQDELRWQQH